MDWGFSNSSLYLRFRFSSFVVKLYILGKWWCIAARHFFWLPWKARIHWHIGLKYLDVIRLRLWSNRTADLAEIPRSLESKQTQGQNNFIFNFLIPFVLSTVMALLGNKCLSLFVKYKVSYSHLLECELCVTLYLQFKDYYFLVINLHILIIHYYFLILLQVLHFFSA